MSGVIQFCYVRGVVCPVCGDPFDVYGPVEQYARHVLQFKIAPYESPGRSDRCLVCRPCIEAEEARPPVVVWPIPMPYDALLDARVQQLKRIDEEIERVLDIAECDSSDVAVESLKQFVRLDLSDMIRVAEAEYRNF